MRVESEIRLTIWTLLALQVVTAAGAIVLLTRVSPAVKNILEENVMSLEAVGRMRHALALPASEKEARKNLFRRGLVEAEKGVTEKDEVFFVQALKDLHVRALDGDSAALRRTLGHLENLAAVNHRSMQRADQRASRLGDAGAWAIAVLGMFCCVASIWAARRTAQRITGPLRQIHDALAAFRAGDLLRRCNVQAGAEEAEEIAAGVNALLDAAGGSRSPATTSEAQHERAALQHILAAHPEARLIITGAGEVLVANDRALEALASDPALRERAGNEVQEPAGSNGILKDVEKLGENLWMATLKPGP